MDYTNTETDSYGVDVRAAEPLGRGECRAGRQLRPGTGKSAGSNVQLTQEEG